MRCIRSLATTWALAIGVVMAAGVASGQANKHIRGVLAKVDASASRLVVRETHGLRHEMPLSVGPETQIDTPAGAGSLAALHVGDPVIVSYGPGPRGEMARRIQVMDPEHPGR